MEEGPFQFDAVERQERLLDELWTRAGHDFESCDLFRKICEVSGWSPDIERQGLASLPWVPTQYFKHAGKELISVEAENIHRYLYSSATSGFPSMIGLDKGTARRQTKALISVLGEFIGKERRPFLICDVQPGSAQSHEMSARAAAGLGFQTFASDVSYALALGQEKGLRADLDRLKTFIESAHSKNDPVILFGFTFLLFTLLLEPLAAEGQSFPLPPGSRILHIGGWKRLEEHKVGREEILSLTGSVFGIGAEGVHDIYGFTEQMGTLHVECAHGFKHAPAFADVIVRDPLSLEPLEDGEIGVGQFVTTVPTSYPGWSVLTDDLVRVIFRDRCDCGRNGTGFEVIGRDNTSEVRGCGDVLAEKIIVASPVKSVETDQQPLSSEIKSGPSVYRVYGDDRLSPVSNWDSLEKAVRGAGNKLAKVSVDDIAALLNKAADIWSDKESSLAVYFPEGLSFVINFIRSGQLQKMLDGSLRAGRGVLDGFRYFDGDVQRIRAKPRGVACHWLAGNVPTLGILSLLMSLTTKNANIVKLPSGGSMVLPQMLNVLTGVEIEKSDGKIINGKILTDAVAVLSFGSENISASEEMAGRADVRMAWGGSDAVKSVMALPRKYDAEDIVFGPKLSVEAIAREALPSDARARRLARAVATDCSVFDQQACASAHVVFVEAGGGVSPEEFAAYLARAMEDAVKRIPRGPMSGKTAGDIQTSRARHLMGGKVFHGAGLEWSVLFKDTLDRPDPLYGRAAQVRAVDDLSQISELLDRDTQVVGLALDTARRAELADLFSDAGVDRIAEPGHMADFASPWDGIFPVERLVRWVSLF